jgi:hypothetical protein
LAFALAQLIGFAAEHAGPEPGSVGRVPLERAECFVLELTGPAADGSDALEAAAGEGDEVGLALLRERREGGRTMLEWQLRFAVEGAIDTRVHHVELREGDLRRLVWREYRPGAGRTLFLEELPGGELRAVEWGGREGRRTSGDLPGDGLFPLELLERARDARGSARLEAERLALFDVLEQRFEPVVLDASPSAAARPAAFAPSGGVHEHPRRRTVEVRRRDGSLAAAYRFAGSELEAFQWQAGTARGRRIDAEEWQRLSRRLDELDASDGDRGSTADRARP